MNTSTMRTIKFIRVVYLHTGRVIHSMLIVNDFNANEFTHNLIKQLIEFEWFY